MVLKYFIIGIIFTFLVELLFNRLGEHPLIKDKSFGYLERLICVIAWPLLAVVFFYSFFKTYFKK